MVELPRIGVVVVAHRSQDPLQLILASLRDHEPDAPVVVVDSGSPEGPPSVGPGVELVALGENVGYGAACNAGAQVLGAVDYFAFLNPDVRFDGATLSELVGHLDARPRIGVAGPPLVDDRGERIASAWGPSSALRKFAYAADLDLDPIRRLLGRIGLSSGATSARTRHQDEVRVEGHVLGGAMVVRRECWDQVGGFDPGFFLYGEDTDLCHRARQAGWEVWVLPATPAVHVQGTSSSGVRDEQRRVWHLEGTRRFGEKHLGPVRRRLHVAALHAGNAVRRWRSSR